jgi:hypothetical protein
MIDIPIRSCQYTVYPYITNDCCIPSLGLTELPKHAKFQNPENKPMIKTIKQVNYSRYKPGKFI